jgi:hypothetical protein
MRDIFQSARRRPDVPGGGVSKVGLRNTHNSLQTDNVEALEGPASGNYSGPTCALFYDYSMVCCLPDGMSHGESVGTGTVMRTSTLNGYARSAGFDAATALAIEHDFFRFYGWRTSSRGTPSAQSVWSTTPKRSSTTSRRVSRSHGSACAHVWLSTDRSSHV